MQKGFNEYFRETILKNKPMYVWPLHWLRDTSLALTEIAGH